MRFWSSSAPQAISHQASSDAAAFYNLVCDGLLSENFAIIGLAMDPMTTESFREKMSTDIKTVLHARHVRTEALGLALLPPVLHAG